MPTFNEADAAKYIRTRLDGDIAENLSNSEILDVIELFFDYYDQLDDETVAETDDEDVADEDAPEVIAAFIIKRMQRRHPLKNSPDTIAEIVALEQAYEAGLDDEF